MDQQPGVACQRRFCVLIATSLKREKGEAAVKYVIVITGASSGFGALTARRLAEAGHTVYATMRETGSTCTRALARVRSWDASARHARSRAPIFSSCRRNTARGRPWCSMAERYSFRRFARDEQFPGSSRPDRGYAPRLETSIKRSEE
jgi:short chain dehydrogenase